MEIDWVRDYNHIICTQCSETSYYVDRLVFTDDINTLELKEKDKKEAVFY